MNDKNRTEAFNRLPKWAKKEIMQMEDEIKALKVESSALKGENLRSRVSWGIHPEQAAVYLDNRETVRFNLAQSLFSPIDENYVDVHIRKVGGRYELAIRALGPGMEISPGSGNVIYVLGEPVND